MKIHKYFEIGDTAYYKSSDGCSIIETTILGYGAIFNEDKNILEVNSYRIKCKSTYNSNDDKEISSHELYDSVENLLFDQTPLNSKDTDYPLEKGETIYNLSSCKISMVIVDKILVLKNNMNHFWPGIYLYIQDKNGARVSTNDIESSLPNGSSVYFRASNEAIEYAKNNVIKS